MPPPGGVPDQSPPRIVSTSPAPLSVVEPFNGAVVFRFDEGLSERNIENSVVVSPATGDVDVSKDGAELRVRISGGWRAGVIYRVLLAPGIRDRFNNEQRTPVDLVFSTGPPIMNTAFGGLVSDRITGRPEPQAVVEAKRRADSLTYVAAVDSLGFFAYRNLPLGFYDVVAYTDRNRNRRKDSAEPRSGTHVVPLNSERDTFDLDLVVLPNDTTPARLVRAEGRDSLQVRLFTDDYLDPEATFDRIEVTLIALPDSTAVEGPFTLMTVDTFNARSRVRADSLRVRADSLRRDSLRVAAEQGDTAAARLLDLPRAGPARPLPQTPRPTGPGGPAALPSIGPPPFQEFVVLPPQPLPPGRYSISVSNLQNISRRVGGGGSASFEIRPPPPPDTTTAKRDTSTVRSIPR